jgi:hypothetical protein
LTDRRRLFNASAVQSIPTHTIDTIEKDLTFLAGFPPAFPGSARPFDPQFSAAFFLAAFKSRTPIEDTF